MAIKINDIPPEGLTLELADKLDLFDQGTASDGIHGCTEPQTGRPAGPFT